MFSFYGRQKWRGKRGTPYCLNWCRSSCEAYLLCWIKGMVPRSLNDRDMTAFIGMKYKGGLTLACSDVQAVLLLNKQFRMKSIICFSICSKRACRRASFALFISKEVWIRFFFMLEFHWIRLNYCYCPVSHCIPERHRDFESSQEPESKTIWSYEQKWMNNNSWWREHVF